MFTRRQMIRSSVLAGSMAPVTHSLLFAQDTNDGQRPRIISTWEFGKPANERALATLRQTGSTLDAVEQGIRLTEASDNASVGLSGKPNAAGYAQLDACIMHGPGHRAGGVAGIEGIVHPITAARRVMEKTPHVLLVGEAARWFAIEQGCQAVPIDENRQRGEQWQTRQPQEPTPTSATPDQHDTIALLVVGPDGTLSGGCSTSGLADKLPGRVGDSPLIGSGLYVDQQVGAAGATGIGENVMRYCGTFLVVEFMRQGASPTDACRRAIDRIASVDPRGYDLGIHFIALDKQGRFGAAGTGDFPHAVTSNDESRVLVAKAYRGS